MHLLSVEAFIIKNLVKIPYLEICASGIADGTIPKIGGVIGIAKTKG